MCGSLLKGKCGMIECGAARLGSEMKAIKFSRYAALAAVAVAAGCGGKGTAHLPTGTINFTGSETLSGQPAADTVVPATGGATVTVPGVSGTTVIPSGSVAGGSTVHSTDYLAIIPSGTGFLGALTGSNSVTVNGVSNSGATITSNGFLGQNLALPVEPGNAGTHYTLTYPASDLNTSRVLTVQNIIFEGTFYIKLSPIRVYSPVPIALKGSLPNNGENAFGSFMNVWWNPNNAGRSAKLFIDYGNGFTLQQTRTIDASGYASFRNFTVDPSNIPPTGVQTVKFTIGPLP
jgi:predicted small lipoprotein YifL